MDRKSDGARAALEQRALGHAARVEILEVLKDEDGGLSAREIQALLTTGLTLARIEYHLRVMAKHGLVVQRGSTFEPS